MKNFSVIKPVKPTGTLGKITDAQREELTGWLNSNRTYKEIKDLVERDFNVSLKTVFPLKQFRKNLCRSTLQKQVFCPPLVPRDVWEFSLAEMVKVLGDANTKIETRVRVSAFLLQVVRLTLEHNRLVAKARESKNAKPKAAPDSNPLENADIEDIRRLLFGLSPVEDKSPTSAKTTPDAATPVGDGEPAN